MSTLTTSISATLTYLEDFVHLYYYRHFVFMMAFGVRKFAITLQVILYIANSAAWVVSILAFTCGFVIGLGNRTIRIDLELLDLAITTPATVFITYGILLTVLTTVGCFSSLSAKIYISIFYICLIILYFIFDVYSGFWLLIKDNSIYDFYQKLNNSLEGYGDSNAKRIGIIPLLPSVYWEHLQRRGECCGLQSFEDWRQTTYGRKQFSVPDSCCNKEYDHRFCGNQVLKHPDRDGHMLADILHPLGCMYIFPIELRLNDSKRVTYLGRFVGCLLLLCGVLTLVIIALVVTKKFKPDQGLNNPDFIEIENQGRTKVQKESVDSLPRHGIGKHKVHPEQPHEGGDRRRNSRHSKHSRHSEKDNRREIKFKEDGPQFIPSGE